MTFGSTIYQYTIASVSGLIAANDSKHTQINNKINILNQYSIKYSLPASTHKKILNYFNTDHRIGETEWKMLFRELPQALQNEIVI
jgi:hypothetical protein